MKPSETLPQSQSDSAVRTIQFLVGIIAIGLVFWRLQFSTDAICCGDFDGYYHIKWTQMLWESLKTYHTIPTFRWLPLTSLNPKQFVDHHFLFHIILIPFARSSDPRLGAKIAAAFFGGLALVSCYWLLIRYHIRYVLVWLIALIACSAPFLFRLNMLKAPPFAIIFLVLAIHFLFQRRYWPLLPIAFLFTETYDLFPLLIFTAISWAAVVGWTEHRFEWRPLLWVSLGIVAGLVINPYFPQNLELMYEHARIKLTLNDYDTKVGGEWYPYDSWEFLGNALVACISMIVGYIALDPLERKNGQYPMLFAILATALMIMMAKWRRIAEYWPPFAVMFGAFSLQAWLVGTKSAFSRLPPDIMKELEPYLDHRVNAPDTDDGWTLRELLKTGAVVVIAIFLSAALFVNLRATIRDIRQSEPHNYYKRGADWLTAHVPKGHTIFNTDWDDFPRLFYYDPNHYYVSGLDPSYLYDRDSRLSQLYERITLGKEEDPGPRIRDAFGATYVFTDNEHHDFVANAQASGWFQIVYEDEDCMIMRIRDEQLSPAEQKDELP
jgi:hypothetical protein